MEHFTKGDIVMSKQSNSIAAQYQRYCAMCQNEQVFNNIISRYWSALSVYCSSVNLQYYPQVDFLASPLSFFYIKKYKIGKQDEYRVFSSFSIYYPDQSSGKKKYINQITCDTYKYLFLAYGLPVAADSVMFELFNALKDLLIIFQKDRIITLLNQMAQHSPSDTQAVLNLISVLNGNIYVQDIGKLGRIFEHVPILSFPSYKLPSSIPKTLLKKYLKEYTKYVKLTNGDEHIANDFACSKILYNYENATIYQVESGTTENLPYQIQLSQTPLPYPQKLIQFNGHPSSVPVDTVEFLSCLAGDSKDVTDRLAAILAKAASAEYGYHAKRVAIICTRINATNFLMFLYGIFNDIYIENFYNGNREIENEPISKLLPSINSYCTCSGLEFLYKMQGLGKGVLVVNDKLISDRALPTAKKLLFGEKVPVKTKDFPVQNLVSNLFFFVLSEDPKQSKKLSKQLNCDFLDLTNFERFWPNVSLPEDVVKWFRTAFLLHGLRILDNPPTKAKIFRSSDYLETFIKNYCHHGSGEMCSREELYNAYKQFYRSYVCNSEPKLTIGRFTKAVNSLIKSDDKVMYKKIRSTQRRYYIGLSCSEIFPKQPSECPQIFREYIEEIHESCPKSLNY